MERRLLSTVSSDAGRLMGYASVYGPLSEDLGGFRERISPAAFTRTLEDKSADVRALINHDSSLVLGRRSAGTLKLNTDKNGLGVEIYPPDTSYAKDLLALIERGDVNQMSFGFIVRADEWTIEETVRVRTVTDVELIEVSVVTIPAYPDTTVAIRSRDQWSASQLRLSVHLRGRRLLMSQLGCAGRIV